MTRMEKLLVAFLCLLVAAFVSEHVYLTIRADRYSPPTLDPRKP
jgi:hypothetical protein